MWSGDIKDIFIVVFATLSFCFALSYFVVLRQSIKLKRDVSKLFIEKTLLQEYVDITKSTKTKEDSDDSIHKENFIKFLSDSRDWSFEYIEDVQSKINKMILDLKPDVEYFEKFGLLYDGHPSYPMLTNFIKSYKELQDLLPKEDYK
jgi:hypothetical protein